MANKIISCVQYHKTQAIKFTERDSRHRTIKHLTLKIKGQQFGTNSG